MDNCIFCKIVAGELPAAVLYEDEHLVAVMDAFPATRGHVLIFPKAHALDLYDLPQETAAAVLPLAQKLARAIRTALQPEGINVIQNNGKAAGQVVMHYHLHIVPRYAEDNVVIKSMSPPKTTPEERAETAASIKRKIVV